MKNYFYSISIISVLLISCSKSKEPEKAIYNIKFSKYALEYVQLKEGSYYIYKDSATGTLDSVIVTRSLLENKYSPESRGYYYYSQAHYRDEFTLTIEHVLPTYKWLSGTAIASSISSAFFNSDTSELLLQSTDFLGYFFQRHSQINTLSITIEGKTYNNVNMYFTSNRLLPSDPAFVSELYYWAKGYGIIKRTTIKGPNGVPKTQLLIRNG